MFEHMRCYEGPETSQKKTMMPSTEKFVQAKNDIQNRYLLITSVGDQVKYTPTPWKPQIIAIDIKVRRDNRSPKQFVLMAMPRRTDIPKLDAVHPRRIHCCIYESSDEPATRNENYTAGKNYCKLFVLARSQDQMDIGC